MSAEFEKTVLKELKSLRWILYVSRYARSTA